MGGAPPSCDDGNVCTDDSCNAATGCSYTNNTNLCDDNNVCTTADVCSGGICSGGSPLDCSDGNLCTDDICDPLTGCDNPNNTAPCDDGNACTNGDTCGGGSCVSGILLTCDDGNVCTDDSCNVATGCVYTNNTAPCDDGNACTLGEACSAGSCSGGAPANCDDGNICTDDSCDVATGCVYTNNVAPCDDSNTCTTADACSAGSCVGGPPLACNDGNVCTDDSCNAASGCVYTNNSAPCDDGNVFDNPDFCSTGVCLGQGGCQGNNTNCDDGNSCTADLCLPSGACQYTNNTAPCDDGDACTTGDSCSAGGCVGGTPLTCNDGNLCTDDSCNPSSGCVYTANSVPCDDGDVCTSGDTCNGGSCVGGGPTSCDDGDLCTDDHCVTGTGCLHDFNVNPCDDGDACSTQDTCSAGVCVGGPSLSCNDSNLCTDDSCDSLVGCVFAPNNLPCDDGDVCTTQDQCSGGSCLGGGPVPCDDGNPCTDDFCDAFGGCTHVANAASCDDGIFCNGADICSAGTCAHSGDPCGGGGVCDATCNESAGNCYAPSGTACDDGDACTSDDVCNVGVCAGTVGGTCGDGIVQEECGEECDQPASALCNAQCKRPRNCGDGFVDAGEECDDGNILAGDGCTSCVLDSADTVCFEGEQSMPSRGAKYIAFISRADFKGQNADGNAEVFLFNRRLYEKQIRRGDDKLTATVKAITQITNTVSQVPGATSMNEDPTLNGSGRFLAFVSNADLELQNGQLIESSGGAGNPDLNKEIYHFDVKRKVFTQVTATSGVDNLHPNMRAFRGRFLMFDSPGNLMAGHCVGGIDDLGACSSNSDCEGVICGDEQLCPIAGAVCGNPDGNREIFEWFRGKSKQVAVRQLTEGDGGLSAVGRSLSFATKAVAISSTSDLLRNKAPASAGSREIYRIIKKAENIQQITQLTSSDFVSESPSQSKKPIIAFASDADLVPGKNLDGNMEIFYWNDRVKSGTKFTQITDTQGCTHSQPSTGAQRRWVTVQST